MSGNEEIVRAPIYYAGSQGYPREAVTEAITALDALVWERDEALRNYANISADMKAAEAELEKQEHKWSKALIAAEGERDAWKAEAESRIDAFEAGLLTDDSAEAMFERINRR